MKYTDGMTIMAYMQMSEVEKWANTFNIAGYEDYRGEDYEAFKTEKAEKLIDALDSRFPNIRSKIDTYYASTPLTYRDYIGTRDGSLYGYVKDYNNPLVSFIPAKTKIPNLLLTGQNLNMHGVLGVTKEQSLHAPIY